MDEKIQQMLRNAMPDAARAAAGIAVKPDTSGTARLKAIDLCLRIVQGPPNRAAGPPDVEAAEIARQALSKVGPALDKLIKSHSSSRIRTKAAKLKQLVGTL